MHDLLDCSEDRRSLPDRRAGRRARCEEELVGRGAAGAIQSVGRAMHLLAQFTLQQPQWSVSELSRATKLHKSVVTRVMATMALSGFVIQDPSTKTYEIGPKAFAVGNAYRPHAVLSQIAQPVMREMTECYGHATSLGVPAGDKFVYLLVSESRLPVRVAAGVGEVRDYHANAIGKVLLAGMPASEVRAIVGPNPLPKLTPYTIDSVDQLLAQLDEVRRTGIAYNRQEAVVGVGAVAAPIIDGMGCCVAGLSVVYPIHLVTEQEVMKLEAVTKAAAAQLSGSLSR